MLPDKRQSCPSPQLEWLNDLKYAVELETMSVLFAKSVSEAWGCTKLFIGQTKESQNENRRSRCIARLVPSDKVEQDNNYKSLVSVPSTSCESLAIADNKIDNTTQQPLFANSFPNEALTNARDSIRMPLMRRRKKKPAVYRHSIRVNDSPDNRISIITSRAAPAVPKLVTSMKNLKSASSSNISNVSADSGQCSGNSGLHDQQISCTEANSAMISSTSSIFSKEHLPMYPRIASSIDHVLRIASTVLTLLDADLTDPKLKRELIQKTKVYIEITQQSQCGPFLQDDDYEPVLSLLNGLDQKGFPVQFNDIPEYFGIYVRKMIEQSMAVFVRVIAIYLKDCVNRDRLLIIALEHLIHLLLFGDDISLEAIKHKTIERLLSFCRLSSTPNDTLRLLLRAVAVLCGVTKGCVQLMSFGGLNTVVDILCNSPTSCAVEAAGILTQLTNANRPFIKPQNFGVTVVSRLLELLDESVTSESVLLCTAAIANLSLSDHITELLYQKNAVIRLVRAAERPNCASAFVYEQTAAIFSRLASCGYDQVLVAQKAVPLLLQMLTVPPTHRAEYHRRVRYKAIVCLTTLASTGIGLKNIHLHNGLQKLTEVLKSEKDAKSAPFALLCHGIKNQLESTYSKVNER
ncbi:unnamed protein product [Bursaphelenchus okinawaensis]|uniref:Protein inscuteable homologue C-terminal domain-containing protein n=1 Tax=Bursaphelenchus okinawaensis TaxID=465554 RepID=A0A811K8B6_9BILA|nr:unnamed protein product [Bursaphelenchus okinawaensis]CAG9093923.1 unnamed protein product [Bursaphelenchus okinawaensis]